MTTQWTLFRIGNLPIKVDLTVGLLGVYILWVMWPNLAYGIVTVFILLGSILLHELSHVAVAAIYGGKARDIVLQLLGGCARMERMPRKPWQEFLMALAGPACSFALGGIAWFCYLKYVPDACPQEEAHFWQTVCTLLTGVMAINFGLGMFNLLPVFPMDGGRALRSLLQMYGLKKVRATTVAVYIGRAIAILWAAVSILSLLGIRFVPPQGLNWFVGMLWSYLFGEGGLFLLLIAWMIWQAGMAELQMARQEAYYNGDE